MKGVIHQRPAPTSVAERMPPTKPSTVFDGDRPGRDLPFAEQLAPDILQHVAELHDDDEEGDEQHVAALVAGDVEVEQRRHVRGAEDA